MENTLNGRGELWRSQAVIDEVRPSGESDLFGESIWTATGPGGSGTTDESLSWNFGGWMAFVLPPSRVTSIDTCVLN